MYMIILHDTCTTADMTLIKLHAWNLGVEGVI